MRSRHVMAVLFLTVPATALAQIAPGRPPATQPPIVQTVPVRPAWEYKEMARADVIALAGKDDKASFVAGLNKLGADGWEIVGYDKDTHAQQVPILFKRPARRSAEARPEGRGEGDAADWQILRLKFARAAELARLMEGVFRGAVGFRVVPDDRTNSLLLAGTPPQLQDARALVERLDVEVDDATPPKPAVHHIRLKQVKASELARTLLAVLGRDEAGHIVPDDRTNSLLITGRPEQAKEVMRLIELLDVEGADPAPKKGQ